jgi:hypothetical protein
MGIYATTPTRADCQRAVRRAWLLDLDWSGLTIRLSTEPLSMVDEYGTARQYTGGILSDPAPVTESNRDGVEDAAPSVGLVLAVDGTDIALRIAQGSRLQEATGNLFEVFVDAVGDVVQTWQRRIAWVIDGRLTRPSFDGPDSPTSQVRVTLEGQPAEDMTPLLEPLAVIDSTTWPEVPSDGSQQGKVYPLVIGTPGPFVKANGSSGATTGSPAYPVTYTAANIDKLLVADGQVAATTVTIYDEARESEAFTVVLSQDGRGQWCSVVDISGAGSISRTDEQYFAHWNDGGGTLNPFGSGAIERLGDVVRWAMQGSTVPVDMSAFAAETDLNRIKVATFLNDGEATRYELAIELLQLHPGAGIRRDANGIRPIVRRMDYPDSACAGTLRAGPGFRSLSEWQYRTESADTITDASMSFAKRVRDGRLRRSVRCTPDPDPLAPEEFATSYAIMGARRQALAFRKPQSRRHTEEIETIYDEASAGYRVASMVRQSATPDRTRDYYGGFEWGWLEVNEVYLYYDDVHTTLPIQVEVTRKEPVMWGYVFTLTVDDDPVRLAAKAL